MKGLFYNLLDGKKIFYVGRNIKKNHLNMAYKLNIIKIIKKININENVDHYIKRSIDKILCYDKLKIVLHDTTVDKENWKYGFFTDGHNSISIGRKQYYYNPTDIFYSYNNTFKLNYKNMENYIPKNVIDFLKFFLKQQPKLFPKIQQNRLQQNKIQQNKIQQNRLQQNRLQQNKIQQNKIQQNRLQQNKIQQNRLQQNKIQQNRLQHNKIQQNRMQNKIQYNMMNGKNILKQNMKIISMDDNL